MYLLDRSINSYLNCRLRLLKLYLKLVADKAPSQFYALNEAIKSGTQLKLVEEWIRVHLRQNPRWCTGYRQLAELFLEERRYGEAFQAALLLAELTPHETHSAWISGRVKLRLGLHKEALSLLKQVFEQKPKDQAVAAELVATLIALKQQTEARDVLERFPRKEWGPELCAASVWVK